MVSKTYRIRSIMTLPNHWHLSLSTLFHQVFQLFSQMEPKLFSNEHIDAHTTTQDNSLSHTNKKSFFFLVQIFFFYIENNKNENRKKNWFLRKKKWKCCFRLFFFQVAVQPCSPDLCATFAGPTVNTRSSSARQEYPTASHYTTAETLETVRLL
jgi:hypothetical protein